MNTDDKEKALLLIQQCIIRESNQVSIQQLEQVIKIINK